MLSDALGTFPRDFELALNSAVELASRPSVIGLAVGWRTIRWRVAR
jgi:hypothetical protein